MTRFLQTAVRPLGWAVAAGLLLLTQPVAAQLTLAWDTVVVSPLKEEYVLSSIRLSGNLFASVGYQDSLDLRLSSPSVNRPLLYLTDRRGRVLRRRVWNTPAEAFSRMFNLLSAPNGFDAFYYNLPAVPGTQASLTWERFDSLGNTMRVRVLPVDTTEYFSPRRFTPLPGGLLAVGNGGVGSVPQAAVSRFDDEGREVWRRRLGYWAYGRFLVPLLDGSYALVAIDPTQYGRVSQNQYRYDYKLYRLTASGGVLDSAWVGVPEAWEDAFQVRPTTDGGLLICGFESPNPYSNPRRGTLIKLDSAFQQQWKYTIFATCCNGEQGAEIHDAWETADGHFLVGGGGDGDLSFVRELIPPSLPTQSPTIRTRYFLSLPPPPQGLAGLQFVYDPDRTLYVFGSHFADYFSPTPDADFYQARLTGLPAPAVLDYCRRPPSRPAATVSALVGDSLRFTVAQAGQTAGPRYAEISLVEWDFGDGTPPRQGWDVWHTFASPTPVTVRLRVCNNLGCCRDSVFYPFGVPVGLPAPAASPTLSVYPNPSASGWFTVRVEGGRARQPATFVVLDAVGRRVATGSLHGSEAALDLRHHPAGVYALRLRWADGQTTSTRLLK